MADAQYTFDSQRNSYFNGQDLRVTETGTGHTILVNEKDGMLAVNVKDDSTVHHLPPDVKAAFDKLGESRVQSIYNQIAEEWWRWADDLAKSYDFAGTFSAGRSSGWCAVDGTQHIDGAMLIDPASSEEDDEDVAALTIERDKFLAFAFEAERSIEENWLPQFYETLKEVAADDAALTGIEALAHKVWHQYPRFNRDETLVLLDALNVRALDRQSDHYGDGLADSAADLFRRLADADPDEAYSLEAK